MSCFFVLLVRCICVGNIALSFLPSCLALYPVFTPHNFWPDSRHAMRTFIFFTSKGREVELRKLIKSTNVDVSWMSASFCNYEINDFTGTEQFQIIIWWQTLSFMKLYNALQLTLALLVLKIKDYKRTSSWAFLAALILLAWWFPKKFILWLFYFIRILYEIQRSLLMLAIRWAWFYSDSIMT